MAADQHLACPDCHGDGHRMTLACGPGGSTFGPRTCETCQGSGEISAAQAASMAEGQRFHDARIAAQVTLRAAGALLGLSPVELSTYERTGRSSMRWVDQARALRKRWGHEEGSCKTGI
jgi:hypothetical protein